MSLQELFREHYTKHESGCWLWEWTETDALGYGRCKFMCADPAMDERAHRTSWIIHRGKIPDGLFVLHKCDVRNCVNPEHLFLGMQQDNVSDMISKGRMASNVGAKNGRAMLTEDQVIEILSLIDEDCMFNYQIAERYGVAPTTISYIKNYGWRHLKEKK